MATRGPSRARSRRRSVRARASRRLALRVALRDLLHLGVVEPQDRHREVRRDVGQAVGDGLVELVDDRDGVGVGRVLIVADGSEGGKDLQLPAALRGLADRLDTRGAGERLDVREDVRISASKLRASSWALVSSTLSLSVFAWVSSWTIVARAPRSSGSVSHGRYSVSPFSVAPRPW